MPTYAAVPVVGPYTVIEDPGGTSTVSSTDALCDSNNATYVEVDQYIGPAGVFPNLVRGTLATGGTAVETRPALKVYARVEADGPLQYVRLDLAGSGSTSFWTLEDSPPPIPSPLGLLYPLDDFGLGMLNNAIRGLTVTGSAAVVPVRTGSQKVRISEFWIVAIVMGGGAPPCRIFPREDGLGVGAGRAYPPPKSQQGSPGNRGVGYY